MMAYGRPAGLVLLLCLAATPVLAQSTSHIYAGGGAVSGFGDHLATLFVVGGEKVRPGGVSIGGEAGLAIAKDGSGGSHPGERYHRPLLSLDAGYRFGRGAFEPFIFTGLSAAGAQVGANVGLGFVHWWRPKVGLRFAVRMVAPFGGETGFLAAQVGVAFRR